jgi:hypothetical protein
MKRRHERRSAATPLRLLNLSLFVAAAALAVALFTKADWPRWAASFALPALWALVAALRPRLFISVQVLGWLWASAAAVVVLLVLRWPSAPAFWSPQVWSRDAAAQAAMGLLFGLGVLMVAIVTAYRTR